jgi:hypothetical protein
MNILIYYQPTPISPCTTTSAVAFALPAAFSALQTYLPASEVAMEGKRMEPPDTSTDLLNNGLRGGTIRNKKNSFKKQLQNLFKKNLEILIG